MSDDNTFSKILLRRLALGWAGCFLLFATACQDNPPANAVATETRRVAIQSQCAQIVIECTSSWPTPVATIEAATGQTVTATDNGFIVEDPAIFGAVSVQLLGADSEPGDGANEIFFSWSHSAADDDPCTLSAGTEFSTEADAQVLLAVGVHYIRLTVRNDIVRELVESEFCGVVAENVQSFDFIELEIEVRN